MRIQNYKGIIKNQKINGIEMVISKEAKLDFYFKLDPKINFTHGSNIIKVLK